MRVTHLGEFSSITKPYPPPNPKDFLRPLGFQSEVLYHRLVGEGVKIGDFRVGVDRHELQHEDGDQLFLRIDPEIGVGRPAPAVISHRSRHLRLAQVEQHADPQAEAGGGIIEGVDAIRQVIGGHQLDRLAPQQAHTLQGTAVEQHLAEAQVIAGRGNQPAPARGIRWRVEVARVADRVDLFQISGWSDP